MKRQMLFSRYALAMHDVLNLVIKFYYYYLAWTVFIEMHYYSVWSCFFFFSIITYSSGHLTRKPYGYLRCPGNKINSVVM